MRGNTPTSTFAAATGLALGLAVLSWGVLTWAGLVAAGPADMADPDDVAQVERGARIYAENCAACHGAELEGQSNWRTQLSTGGLPAPPHDETGHTWHHADGILFIYTKLGAKEGLGIEGFQSNMPAFRDTLSDADIWASLGYIMSRWPERVRQRQDHINERSK